MTVASTHACAPGASCSPHHHIVSVTGLVVIALLGLTDADAPIKLSEVNSTAAAEPTANALPRIFIRTLLRPLSRSDFGSQLERFPVEKASTCKAWLSRVRQGFLRVSRGNLMLTSVKALMLKRYRFLYWYWAKKKLTRDLGDPGSVSFLFTFYAEFFRH